MAEFNFDNLDISRVNNETIAELGEVLWQFTAAQCREDVAIMEKYSDSVDALVDSLDPKQQKWFKDYQEMVVDELSTRLTERGYHVEAYNRSGYHVSGKEFDEKRGKIYNGIRLITIGHN